VLPRFSCEWELAAGARELREVFERISLTDDMFRFHAYTRLKQLEHLLRTGQLDGELFWTA
jgi:hypothetical protein